LSAHIVVTHGALRLIEATLETASHAHAHGAAHLASVLLPVVLVQVSTVLVIVVVAAATVVVAPILLEGSLLATNVLRPVLIVVSGVRATAIGFLCSVVWIDASIVSNVTAALTGGFGQGRNMVLDVPGSFGAAELDVAGSKRLKLASSRYVRWRQR
jgi:hypothetical protein